MLQQLCIPRTFGRLARSSRGGVALEFAFVAPVLVVMLWGIIEYGRLMWWQSTVRNAVEEGARCKAVNYSSTNTANGCCAIASFNCTSPEAYAAAKAAGLGLSSTNFDSTAGSSATTGCMTVQASGGGPLVFKFIVPSLVNPQGATISSNLQVCYPI